MIASDRRSSREKGRVAMKTVILAASLVVTVSAANAHSLKSAYCNAKFAVGEPMLNIVVQPDGSLWYEDVTMANGALTATFHQLAASGGTVGKFTAPCTMP